ncbi:MAG: magnesium-translocating P-type ATPase, partial [Deltaproteobacteria bacterium]|nr:magnesium-translocating P-type ATPase [Deltaproteobacteria bacterium]
MIEQPHSYWSIPEPDLMALLRTNNRGLKSEEAVRRLVRFGANRFSPPKRSDALTLFISQFKSPIILTLIFAAGLSAFLHDPEDAAIIIAIVLASGLLGFWQERGAVHALQKMLAIVKIKARVLRDGSELDIDMEDVVPGDIIVLAAGDAIPADSLLLESRDLFVDEATLTGESFPVEKNAGQLPVDTPLARRANRLFMGTHVASGTATA